MITRRTAVLPAATVALGMLALPPINAWPMALMLWLPALWLAAHINLSRALVTGLLTGAAFGVYLFFGAAVLDVTAMLGATIVVALGYGVFVACASRLLQQPSLLAPILLGCLWVSIELLFEACGVPFTLAVMLADAPTLLQPAALGGQHLVVFFVVATQSALLAWSLQPGRRMRGYTALFLIAAFALTITFGKSQQPPASGTLHVAAMQTDIHPFFYVHAEADMHLAHLNEQRRLLETKVVAQDTELVVWPEVPFARFEWRNPLSTRNAEAQPYAALVAGNDLGPDGRQYNAVFGIDTAGEVRSRHVKNTLLPRLERDYVAGDAPAPHAALPGRPGSLICYESAFGKTATALTRQGAEILTIATSDVYAGPSLLPAFHAAFAVVRAVENRRTVVRAANGGPSMIVLPSGRISARLPLFESGVLTAAVPVITQQSFFTQTASAWRIGFAIVGVIGLWLALTPVPAVRGQPHWPFISATLLLLVAGALAGQWHTVVQQYSAARPAAAPVTFGFLGEMSNAPSYRQLASANEQDDLAAVVAAALRRFGVDATGATVAQRISQLRQSSIVKIDAAALLGSFGFKTAAFPSDDVRHSVTPCAALLNDGSTVLITRHAPDALEIFSPGEADYSTVPRYWLEGALARAPVCIVGRAYSWDLP